MDPVRQRTAGREGDAMKKKPADVVAIGPLIDDLKYLGSRDYMGKPEYFRVTPIGRVGGATNGMIVIDDMKAGKPLMLSPKDGRELASAISRAAYLCEELARNRSGYNTIRTKRLPDGAVEATLHGQTAPMRVSKLKKARTCRSCRKETMEAWVEDRTAVRAWTQRFESCVCLPCERKLSGTAPKLRLMSTGEEE